MSGFLHFCPPKAQFNPKSHKILNCRGASGTREICIGCFGPIKVVFRSFWACWAGSGRPPQ